MIAMLLGLLQEAQHLGPSSPFEVEFGLIFWTWLVFIGLFLVLKKYAWPAILSATEERERKIARQLGEAEKMNAEAMAALEEHKRLLVGAKEDAAALVNEAKTVAQKERETMLAKAREDQGQILERAKREIAAERERALTEIRQEAVDLSLAAASRLVDANLDDEANRKLVVDYLGSVESGR
ncbi:MAG: F0F1 ATP synthase subunit B [Gemmatimonadetes bacterium]|nr:F0F1 ATP synthase subunit B [Gemmatimonadota bacterium]